MTITIITSLRHFRAMHRILRLGNLMFIIWGAQYIITINGLIAMGYSDYAITTIYVAITVLLTILVCTAFMALIYRADGMTDQQHVVEHQAAGEKA